MKNILIFTMIFGFTIGFAQVRDETSGNVTGVYHYGSGRILVTGFTFSICNTANNCSNNGGFFISESHPKSKELLATILTAKTTGQALTVKAVVENVWYPMIDESNNTRIVFKD